MAGIRLSGLASGIDTETMIKQLMQAERAPVDRLSQKKQTLTWQRDAYREINRSLLNLRVASSDMLLTKNYQSKVVTNSNPSALTVTASPGAISGSLTIDKVEQLASAASVTLVSSSGKTSESTLDDSGLFIKDGNGMINIQINTFNTDGKAVTETIQIDAKKKISDLTAEINGNSSLGMSAVFNDLTGKLVLTKTSTGNLNSSGADISLIDASNGMPIVDTLNTNYGREGQNAKYIVGGQELEQTSNTFTQNGLTITFNNVTTTPITLTTKLDVQANFDSIKNFVDKYNELIDKMNSKVKEEKYRDFQPLTDDQRKELSDDQVKKWEEKAQSGILRNDDYLQNGINLLRSSISAKIDTGYSFKNDDKTIPLNYLSQIGITTTSDYRDGGKLRIDENKLKKMLEENPEGVYKLFTVNNTSSSSPISTVNVQNENGFIRKIQSFVSITRDNISKVAGLDGAVITSYRLGSSLSRIDKDILSWEDKLKRKEDNYFKKFSAMESAMNQANSQSATLASYLGQG